MENFKVWIKKNWQICVMILLCILFLNKCTTSCSRGQKIKTQNIEITRQDSIIKEYTDSIKYLNITIGNLDTQLSSEKSHTTNFAGIATGNQKELSTKVDALTKENKQLKTQIKNLEKDNKNLQFRIDTLTK